MKKRATSLETSDQKMDAAVSVWKGVGDSCKTDAVLNHIMSSLAQ